MKEPACYRCVNYEWAASPGWAGSRCKLGNVHEFPHIGCEEFDSEAGTDWEVRNQGSDFEVVK